MGVSKQWLTPFLKQCFVTLGVTLNMGSSGYVLGFAICLLEQLRAPESDLPIDDSIASWIASSPAISMCAGNLLVIPIMDKYGTRTANMISISLLIVGWTCLIFSTNIALLLFSRILQGICTGMCGAFSSFLIGEYTSPKNRGAFVLSISITLGLSILLVHSLGSYLRWKTVAVVAIGIASLDLIIVLCSPESPSWLATQGKYEECKRTFRWLRGDVEEDELRKIIEASIIIREAKAETKDISDSLLRKLQKCIIYIKTTFIKKEVYKPLIIIIHIYAIPLVGGINILLSYAADWFRNVVYNYDNVPLLIITTNIQRLISTIILIYFVKKVKRRTLILSVAIMNIITLVAIAVYTFAREKYSLPFDHPIIGILLTHCMMFSTGAGSLSLSYIIAGEILPLECKRIASGISVLFYSTFIFLVLKTFPHCLNNYGVYGTSLIYALILIYCLSVVWAMLPETKDRTLQDIEDEFRGGPLSAQDLKSVQPLTLSTRNN